MKSQLCFWTKVKVKQFSCYFKIREIKVNKVMLYRFFDRFISVRDIRKIKNSNQKTRFVLFMFTAVDRLKWWIGDSSWRVGRLPLLTKVLLIFLFFSYFLVQSFLFFLFSQSWNSYFPIFLGNHAAGHPVKPKRGACWKPNINLSRVPLFNGRAIMWLREMLL